MARKGRTYFHGRMAVLFKQGKTKNQVLQYYKKRYFPNNSLQEVEQILNKNRGINAFLLTKTQQKPKETFARFKKIGEIFRKAQTGRKHTKQTKKKIAEAQKKRYKASKERKKNK